MKHAGKLATLSQAMNAPAPTLGSIQREKNAAFTHALIMGWLVYLNDILNLNKPMTEDQIELCAQEVNSTYYNLKMSDLTYLFKKIISGQYGEFYESLTIAKILSFFREYFEERCEIAEQESHRTHADFSSNDAFNYSQNLRRIWNGKSNRS
ncbi:MAG: hypothetical protein BM557_06385 [Flavobacterium sp. MedPE-SWcel]|uniref:hypothetical protein n=1 Tax=uncultured Flavobacterium sp. TaxID=165435 RepID=UPI00091890EB|nr:hypothetical protein [uncultured Flavobacterium sp.]OIQ19327.1 MAG: hypothetical protein BM557_06385 [Flavobacterium sp. MedPE-SWcel]